MEYIELGYFGLFIVCFLAATIIPVSSEVVLAAFLYFEFDPFYCLIVATLGNSLGGLTNYGIGYIGKVKWLLKLGVSSDRLQKMEKQIGRYGFWLAFFSWIPFIGDPLLIALGYFKAHFFKVLLFMVAGKFLRYLLLVYFFY